MMEKASKLGEDMVILDCEDSVSQRDKVLARQSVSEALERFDWTSKEVGIRINGFETTLWLDDLTNAVKCAPDFILTPKIEQSSEVALVDQIARHVSRDHGKVPPRLIVAIENTKGLMNLENIFKSSELITAVEFGAEDYALSLGILSLERSEMSSLYARSKVVAISRACSIDALDQAFVNLTDVEGLRKSAIEAKNLGFKGKSVIHPSQIEVVNEVFGPSQNDISWARRVLEAWKDAQNEGKGAFRLDDKMVDIVHVKMAEEILRIAEEIGT
jgi:citrate lyase subunit beta/citryl-CoA lyase